MCSPGQGDFNRNLMSNAKTMSGSLKGAQELYKAQREQQAEQAATQKRTDEQITQMRSDFEAEKKATNANNLSGYAADAENERTKRENTRTLLAGAADDEDTEELQLKKKGKRSTLIASANE